MNRRDFLFLRTTPKGRTLELSCRSLYMRVLDADAVSGSGAGSILDHEPWMGEPPTDFDLPSGDSLIDQVEADLQSVDVLRVLDREWLEPSGLADRIEPVLAAFRQRGGRIEFGRS